MYLFLFITLNELVLYVCTTTKELFFNFLIVSLFRIDQKLLGFTSNSVGVGGKGFALMTLDYLKVVVHAQSLTLLNRDLCNSKDTM